MKCDRVRHLISEGYDRRLSPTERMEISGHIQSCAGCARFERTLHSGLDGISHLPEIAPSPQLWEAVHTRTAMVTGVTPSRLAKQAAGMVGAAAAVALVAVLTILLLNNNALTTTTNKQPELAAGTTASPTASAGVTSGLTQQMASTPLYTPTPATPATAPFTATASAETGSVIGTATPSTPTAVSTRPEIDKKTAENTVIGYFHAINLQDYSTAYGYLGSALQQQQSLVDFTKGYGDTNHDTLTITGMKPDQSGRVVVVIYLDAEQSDGSVRRYHGQYIVGYENGGPKIVDATVNEDIPATPTPDPASSATACLAGELSALVDYQGATGSMAGSIVFTNTGAEACTLQGTADVKILDSNGQEIATDQKTMSLDGRDQPVMLKPAQQASLFFVWSNWCPPGTAETSAAGPVTGGVSFRVTLPEGQGSITIAAKHPDGTPDTLVPRCDVPGRSSTLSVGTFKADPAS